MKHKTAKGSIIAGGVMAAMRPINLVASLILLRLLDPVDFGAVALAMLLLTTSNLFSGLGMGVALIHSKIETNKTAFHAFVMMMTFATILSLLVYFNDIFFATLLGNPNITLILRWMSLYIVIDTSSTIPVAILRKRLQFGRVSMAVFASELTYTAVSLTLAFSGFGLWSLVYGRLGSSLVKAMLSWLLCPGWEWLKIQRWDKAVAKSLLRFGVQSTGSGFVSYFHTHSDDWFVSHSLGTAALGIYSKAYDLTNKTMNKFSQNVIGLIFLPSYAKIQNDKERLARAYIKSVRLVLLITVPMAFGIYAIAPEMVPLLWEDKWVPMVPILQIYALILLARPISENAAPLFQAIGKPKLNTRAGLVLLVVMIPLVFLLIGNGIAGVATAVVISHFVGMLFNVYQMNKEMPGTAKESLKLFVPMLSIGAVMATAVTLAKAPLQQMNGGEFTLASLFIAIAIGAILYFIGLLLTQRPLLLEIFQTMSSVIMPKLRRTRVALQK